MLRGNYLSFYHYILKEEKSQINSFNIYLEKLEIENKWKSEQAEEKNIKEITNIQKKNNEI